MEASAVCDHFERVVEPEPYILRSQDARKLLVEKCSLSIVDSIFGSKYYLVDSRIVVVSPVSAVRSYVAWRVEEEIRHKVRIRRL